MRTLVLRVAEKNGYSIELLDGTRGGDGTLTATKVASATLPASLAPAQEVQSSDGQNLTAARVRELYSRMTGDSDEYEALGEFVFRLLARGDLATKWRRLR